MSRKQWLEVDLAGLERILSRRGKEFVLYELVQNAWDERCTEVKISLPKPDRGKTHLVVSDDSPHGFCNLTHTFTLFAESNKKEHPQQRGIFNAGEKLVLACCEEASVISTRGGVVFDAKGRRRTSRRTQHGTVFSGLLRLSAEDWNHICQKVPTLIPPVKTIFNGQPLAPRKP